MKLRAWPLVVKLCCSIAFVLALGVDATSAPEPYTISLITDLTGPNAFAGNDYADTARAFEHYFNKRGGIRGTPIHFDIRDSETSPQVAVQLVGSLLPQHPAVIAGPAQTGQCGAVAPLMVNGPLNYCLSPGLTPKLGGYVFASSVALDYIEPAMMRYARLSGYRRLGIITSTDASGQANEDATLTALARPENKTVTVVASQHFNVSDTSVAAQVANLKAANPDVIVIWANGTAFGTVLRALKDAGIDLPVITTGANLNQRLVQQFISVIPTTLLFNGIVYYGRNNLSQGPLRSRIDDYNQAFKEIGKSPTPSSGYTWDPLLIITSALQHLGTSATASQLRTYIADLRGFVGISGVYDFRNDQHGLTDTSVIMVRWDAKTSAFVPVSRGGGIPLK